MPDFKKLVIAYFSMEIGIDNEIPTYAGGLGVLAGDTLRSATDLGIPMIGITLLYKHGYFFQHINDNGWQEEKSVRWNPEDKLEHLPNKIKLHIDNRDVYIGAWVYSIKGVGGRINPILFLDSDLPENSHDDRQLTKKLYSGDKYTRLAQEIILGIGGIRMLESLEANSIKKYHMNEGHSAFLTIELFHRWKDEQNPLEMVKKHCVFTTHTPVPAGHDKFDQAMVEQVLSHDYTDIVSDKIFKDGQLNMTKLGIHFSDYVNGVAKKHGKISRDMFPGYQIDSITNGIHSYYWTHPTFRELFDKHIPGWRSDPYSLRYVLSIPGDKIWQAHKKAKVELISHVNKVYGAGMDENIFTIGFARRAAEYKRGDMLFADIERLKSIAHKYKGIQIVYAGKAHPSDELGKKLIQKVINAMKEINPSIKACYIENYNINVAKLAISGVDLWLNTPIRPQEASGTSGMKAAHNGVPHFSVLDGWWLEGHIENVTGWSIGGEPDNSYENNEQADIEDMYTKLEYVILPKFYNERDEWIKMMRHSIAINGSFFNTHRMVQQYVLNAYFI